MHHLDPELLHAVVAGDLPAKVLVRQLLSHVGELCPECERVLAALRAATSEGGDGALRRDARSGGYLERPDARSPAPGDRRLVGVVGRVQERTEAWAARVRRERSAARREVRELLRTPAAARRRKVERARERFRSRAVAELLLEESRRLVREDPEEARSVAELVPVVVLWTPGAVGEDWARELTVRAHAWVANTHRVAHRFRQAERVFAEVRQWMARDMVGEEVHADIASLEAALRLDQGRYDAARRLLEESAVLYKAADEETGLARVSVQRAILEGRVGDLEEAASFQRQALAIFEHGGDSRQIVESAINLALFLAEKRDGEEGASILAKYEAMFRQEGLWEEPNARMIRGRIALAQHRPEEAERLFLAARAELIRRGDAVRAAVASLDLAVLYLAQGKWGELRRMARLMGSIFESAELENEALAAVVLFQKAVEAESVTEAAIRVWRRQLEVGRPARREEPVS